MTCANPEIGALITRYELGLVNEQERKQFEEHVLSCDACFADLHNFSPVVEALQEHREKFLEVLSPRRHALVQVKEAGRQWLNQLLSGLKVLGAPVPVPIRILAPALAVAAILLFIFAPAGQYAHLAAIERYDAPPAFRTEEYIETEKLFQQGLVYYRQNNDSAAIDLLGRSVQLAPTNAAAHFYLGVSFLLKNSTDSAIVHLQKAIALKDTMWEQSSRWYLGNAYLLQNNVELAQAELQAIVATKGEFSQPAEELLEKINLMQQLPWWRRYFQKTGAN